MVKVIKLIIMQFSLAVSQYFQIDPFRSSHHIFQKSSFHISSCDRSSFTSMHDKRQNLCFCYADGRKQEPELNSSTQLLKI